MTKLHGIYVTNLNNETEFIIGILGKMERDLDISKFRTSIGQRSFKDRGTKIWNELDKELKSTSDRKETVA